MRRVISCSRRTDIPSFYSQWLINRLRSGYCHTINPFNNRVYSISLKPEDCIALVFWTRNPLPLIKHLDEIEQRGYRFYFQYSILGYPKDIESHNIPLDQSLSTFKQLVDRLSPHLVRWRYDPIILSSLTTVEYHVSQFEKIASELKGYTNHCVFSFVEFYDKTSKNLDKVESETGLKFGKPTIDDKMHLLEQFQKIVQKYGMTLNSCCDDSLQIEGVHKNHCVDLNLLRKITRNQTLVLKKEPTRDDCGCVASVDIGAYDTCLFGCSYCYATRNRKIALSRHASHDSCDSILFRPDKLKGVDLNKTAVEFKSK